MKMRNRLAGVFLAVGAALASPSSASAITMTEYDAMTSNEKGVFVEGLVVKMLDYYTSAGEHADADKAACIMDLFTPGQNGEASRGTVLLMRDFERARRLDPGKYHVEGILFGIVSRECRTPQP